MKLPDMRTGKNCQYAMYDIASSAFAVLFLQSPSFLAYQRDMQRREGRNNAHSLFGNVLKNQGYHLEHNYGHGNQYLSQVLLMLILLAFLCHTVLQLADIKYQSVRAELATRKTFFDDVRALTRYLFFDSWESLLDFMMTHLERAAD